jgi:hypothetical protein
MQPQLIVALLLDLMNLREVIAVCRISGGWLGRECEA